MTAKPEGTTLVLVGTSNRRARVELSERLCLTPHEAATFARNLADDDGEAGLLSTCNRTEVYLAHQEGGSGGFFGTPQYPIGESLRENHLHQHAARGSAYNQY